MTTNPHNPKLPYFKTEPFGLEYFDNAPVTYVNEVELDMTPTQLFDVFEDAKSWPVWAKGIAKVDWTSPRPFNVGTTRTVTFIGGMEVYETFTAWESGKEMAFCFTGTTQEVWKQFGEHYSVEDLGEGRCKLRWVVAYEPTGTFAKLHSVIQPIMRRTFAWYMRRLKTYCRQYVRHSASTPARA